MNFYKFFLFIILFCWHILAVYSANLIQWDAVVLDTTGSAETEPIHYWVYGETYPQFNPTQDNFLVSTKNTSYTHVDSRIGQPNVYFYYVIIAVDAWGNRSEYSSRGSAVSYVLSRVKIFLEGVTVTGDSMSTILINNSLLPKNSPYSGSPRSATAFPNSIVDWIHLDISSSPGASPVAHHSFLLRNDGQIVEPDGLTSDLGLANATDGDYYINVRHRNHLLATSSSSVSTQSTAAESYDFTTGHDKYYNTAAALNINDTGTWGMRGGDLNGDDAINQSDFNEWFNDSSSGVSGYQKGDINFDMHVTTRDYTIWYNNSKFTTSLSNSTSSPHQSKSK